MIKYLKKIFSNFPEEITKFARGKHPESPGADYLFKTRGGEESQKFLPKEQAQVFHRSVAQLMLLCMRARLNIQTAISFLTKRVRSPDEYDWGKLKRVLG